MVMPSIVEFKESDIILIILLVTALCVCLTGENFLQGPKSYKLLGPQFLQPILRPNASISVHMTCLT
jgi:hypothetical protein